MKIDSSDQTIKQLLRGGYLRIPRFQRPYSWTVANVEDFWDDTVAENAGSYFIGSIIVFPSGDETYDLVDGQQRVTTITLLLAAIRDAYTDASLLNRATGLHQYVERGDVNADPQYVLQTVTSYPYLQEHIQKLERNHEYKGQLGNEEVALKRAYELLSGRVGKVVEGIIGDPTISAEDQSSEIERRLDEIRNKILGLNVIRVEVDDEDDAYVIFETLNTRGKDLNIADLLKNFIMQNTKKSNKNVDLARDKWAEMLDLFENSSANIDVDEFLLHAWMSRNGLASSKTLFKAIKKRTPKRDAYSLLEQLIRDALIYRAIAEPSYRDWTKEEFPVRDSLEALITFGMKQPRPFILAILRAYDDGQVKLGTVRKALKSIESFHFLTTAVVGRSSSGGVSSMYASAGRNVFVSETQNQRGARINDLVGKLRARIPSEEEFHAAFAEIGFSSKRTQQKRLVQYILRGEYLHHASGVVPDFAQMTIEHLASEHPPANVEQLSDRDIESIGNLILLDGSTNDDLANQDFLAKQILLADVNCWVDPFVLTVPSWGSDEIATRVKVLSSQAYSEIWTV